MNSNGVRDVGLNDQIALHAMQELVAANPAWKQCQERRVAGLQARGRRLIDT